MVTKDDLAKANRLANETREISRAIQILDSGGRIMAMMVGNPNPSPDSPAIPGFAQVDVSTLDYPAPMVESIKAQFRTRQQAINSELSAMGVTEVPEPLAAARPTRHRPQ